MRTQLEKEGAGRGLTAAALGLALALTGCGGGAGGGEVVANAVEQGHELYIRTCSMCHGINGEGVQRLGKSLRDSSFARGQSDEELVRFLIEGRGPEHPDNTQGIAMPPRGGNPGLSDEDLGLIVAYVRSISE